MEILDFPKLTDFCILFLLSNKKYILRHKMKAVFVLLVVLVLAVVRGASLDVSEDGGPSGCCDWPSCYDERTQLCLDTCLNTWTQGPE